MLFLNKVGLKKTQQESYYSKLVESILEKAEREISNLNDNQFYANDIDKRNIEITKNNIQKCFGKNDFVTFYNKDFLAMSAPTNHIDILLFNPPYGERMRLEDTNEFYYQVGETLKNKYAASKAYIFTLHGDLRKNIQLKTSKKIPFYNGDLNCRLYEYCITPKN